MSLTTGQRKALERIESEMARKGFNLADIIEAFLAQSVVVLDAGATGGGSASEALTVTGLLTTDKVLAVQRKSGGASVSVNGFSAQVTDGLTVEFSANPTAGALVQVVVLR